MPEEINPLSTNVLRDYRTQIDAVDRQLFECLSERLKLSQEIAGVKLKTGSPVYQAGRAKEVERNFLELAETHGLNVEFVLDLYRMIHTESCRVQQEFQSLRSYD